MAEGPHSPGHAAFISYASPDRAVADAVCAALERDGVHCWIAPRDVLPGEFHAESIVRAIDAAAAIVVVLSHNTGASPHVIREVERATSHRRAVVSLRTDLTPLPASLEYFLNTSHWLDASESGVERALPKLVEAVRRATLAGPAEATKQPASPPATPARQGSSRPLVALCLMLSIIVAYFFVTKFILTKPAARAQPDAPVALAPDPPSISEKSVAVLPFVDMSEKKDQEYFSDGIAEELIDLLVKVPELRVPARTSSSSFKGKSTTIPQIARQLGVANVLEGSVRRSGDHLRVTAQLVRADTGYHVWSETYDRQMEDVFKVQDEIAAAVVRALKISMLHANLSVSGRTENREAYTLYLQASSSWQRGTASDYHKAVEYLEKALALDPNYAAAWAELALVRVDEFTTAGEPSEENAVYRRVSEEAEKSLALDPKLSSGHLAKGLVFMEQGNSLTAESEFKLSITLDPHNSEALRDLSYLYEQLGRYDDAVKIAEAALSADPVNSWSHYCLGEAKFARGMLNDAEATYRKSLELNPAAAGVRADFGRLLLAKGDPTAGT